MSPDERLRQWYADQRLSPAELAFIEGAALHRPRRTWIGAAALAAVAAAILLLALFSVGERQQGQEMILADPAATGPEAMPLGVPGPTTPPGSAAPVAGREADAAAKGAAAGGAAAGGGADSGEADSGEAVSGGAVSGGADSGEAVRDEAANGEAVRGEAVRGEAANGEAVRDPEAARRFYESGIALLMAGRSEEAVADFNACVQADQTFCLCYRALGITYARLNNGPWAARYYRLYVKVCPEAPDVHQVENLLKAYGG